HLRLAGVWPRPAEPGRARLRWPLTPLGRRKLRSQHLPVLLALRRRCSLASLASGAPETPARARRRLTTPSGSWDSARVLVLALGAAARLVVAEEAGELRGECVAGRNVELLAQRVAAILELPDVGLRLLVLGDGLAHLALVRLGRALEVAEVEAGTQQLRQTGAERESGSGARRKRGIVGHGGPQAGRGEPFAPAGVVEDADDPRGSLVP